MHDCIKPLKGVLLALTIFASAHLLRAGTIPFAAALNAAAVVQPAITNIAKNGLVIGNGELNAIVYTSGNQIRLRISKNDCWDDRVNTSSDPALPKINPATVFWTWGGSSGTPPPSWGSYIYPTQLPCVEVVLGAASGHRHELGGSGRRNRHQPPFPLAH